MRKKNRARRINLPDCRLYYKATVTETVWYWHKNRNIDQWSSIESAEVSPRTYGHFIIDKGGKLYNGGKTTSSVSGAGKLTATRRRMKLEHFLTPHTKINSKGIKSLNVWPKL